MTRHPHPAKLSLEGSLLETGHNSSQPPLEGSLLPLAGEGQDEGGGGGGGRALQATLQSAARRWPLLITTLLCLFLARPAHADLGDLRLGGTASWQVLRTGKLGAWTEYGLGDFVAARLEADAAYGPLGWQGMAAIGPTFYLDVATWVPAATVAVGITNVAHDAAFRALLRGEMRRYFAPHMGFGLGIAGEMLVHPKATFSLVVSVSFFGEP